MVQIGKSAFLQCSGLTGDLEIPNSVTQIDDVAFGGCSGFTGSLVIPGSLTQINNSVFSGCSGFTGKLEIPGSVTRIGEYAFDYCSGFTGDLVIPDQVTGIGRYAFRGCSGFNGTLTLSNKLSFIDDGVFADCSGFTGDLVIPDGVITIGGYKGYAFSGCSGFNGSLKIPDSVTEIDEGSFMDCSGFMGSLVIPNSVTYIKNYAFANCSGFDDSLVLSNNVEVIGTGAFSGCSGFTGSLEIPGSVYSIDGEGFRGCSGFTGELRLPDSVTTIGRNAFQDCSGLEECVVPGSVELLPDEAFKGCRNLVKMSVGAQRIGGSVIVDCGQLKTVDIMSTVEEVGKNAFYGGVDDPARKITVWGKETVIQYYGLGKKNEIWGYRESTAETYAGENECTFTALDDVPGILEDGKVTSDVSGLDIQVTIPMTEEEQKDFVTQVAAGAGMDGAGAAVKLSVTDGKDTLEQPDKQTVDEFAETEGLAIGQYLDIAMSVKSVMGDTKSVKQIKTAIRLVLEVPENLREAGRVFSVIRFHAGESVLLEDLDENPDTITIETDRFSFYTLAYKENDGYVISGRVTSFGNREAEIQLKLLGSNGETSEEAVVVGNTAEYRLENIVPGSYTLQVSKEGHAAREYTVTVLKEAVTLDVEIWRRGDVNGDGEVDAKDKRILYNHIASGILTGYEFQVGDVDGSGEIDAKDKRMLYNHIAGTGLLW